MCIYADEKVDLANLLIDRNPSCYFWDERGWTWFCTTWALLPTLLLRWVASEDTAHCLQITLSNFRDCRHEKCHINLYYMSLQNDMYIYMSALCVNKSGWISQVLREGHFCGINVMLWHNIYHVHFMLWTLIPQSGLPATLTRNHVTDRDIDRGIDTHIDRYIACQSRVDMRYCLLIDVQYLCQQPRQRLRNLPHHMQINWLSHVVKTWPIEHSYKNLCG